MALVPEVVRKLAGQEHEITVERGAGAGALIPDSLFEEAGAKLVDDPAAVYACEVVVKVAPPTPEEFVVSTEPLLSNTNVCAGPAELGLPVASSPTVMWTDQLLGNTAGAVGGTTTAAFAACAEKYMVAG